MARVVDTLVGPDDLVIVPGLGGDPTAYYLARLAEKQGKTPARVLDLETGLPKVGKQLWQAPDADRYLRVETPWRRPPAGLVSLIEMRFPCHRQVGRSQSSGMILWIYERDPACTAVVPGMKPPG